MSQVSTVLEHDRPVLSVLRRMHPHEMDVVITTEVARLREVAAAAGPSASGDAFGIFHAPITQRRERGPLEIVLPVDGLAISMDRIAAIGYPEGSSPTATRTGRKPTSLESWRSTTRCQLDHEGRSDSRRTAARDLAQRPERP